MVRLPSFLHSLYVEEGYCSHVAPHKISYHKEGIITACICNIDRIPRLVVSWPKTVEMSLGIEFCESPHILARLAITFLQPYSQTLESSALTLPQCSSKKKDFFQNPSIVVNTRND